MHNLVKRVLLDQSGASAAEYGVLVALIVVVIVVGVGAFGSALNGLFNNLAGASFFTQTIT